MKLSDGFDARRLRPKGQSNWRFRFGAAIAAILATFGVLLAMAGAASLLGRPPALGRLECHADGFGDHSGGRFVVPVLRRGAVASMPASRPAIAGTEHVPTPDEKTRLR